MKKITLILIMLILLCLPQTALAQSGGVWDKAALLEETQVQALVHKISELEEKYGQALAILTIDDAQGKSSRNYADDFMADHEIGLGADLSGTLLLIDMDNREAYIVTAGITIRYLTDYRLESILDDIYTDLGNGDFYQSADTFLSSTEAYLSQGIPGDQHNYDEETGAIDIYKEPATFYDYLPYLLGSLALGFIVAIVHNLSIKRQYAFKTNKSFYPHQEKSNLVLTVNNDQFINKTVTHVREPKNPPSSGGGFGGGSGGSSGRSTTHSHSSSGRSFGGGGRKF